MIGLGLLAAGLTAGQGGLSNARPLEPFFAKLARQAEPANRRGAPVHILQIGDSHTAGDAITGAWRDILQGRYGSGGRGVLPPGRPYDGFTTKGVTATMSPGWVVQASFGKGSAAPRPPLGLSGFSLTAQTAGARIGMVADSAQRFDRFVVCALTRPGGGALSIRVGPVTERMDLGSLTERPECKTICTDSPAEDAEVTVAEGPVTITSIASFRDAGGVAVSNLGIVGSQLVHFARTDDQVIAEELRAYDPDLIVIAFGTNEGFSPRFTPFEYEVTLRNQIGRIRRLAGNVPILLLGAPDAASRRVEMRNNASGYETRDCAGTAPPVAAAAPPPPRQLGPLEAVMAALRGEEVPTAAATPAPAPVATPPRPAGGLFPPAALQAVREVQRRVAGSLGVSYWDWNARMGGRCTSVTWARATPPLMRTDYVHYTSAGGREIAGRLQADLDHAAAAR